MLGLIYLLIFTFSLVKVSDVPVLRKDYTNKIRFFKPVIEELLKKGVDTTFIYSLLANSKTHFSDRYVKINVLGFLKKKEVMQAITWRSLEKTRAFIKLNLEILTDAETKFGVPKEVITSILWIETKLGSYLGSNHIPSVFFSAAMSNKSVFINMNISSMHEEYDGDSTELLLMDKKIYQRAKTKAEWALNELVALSRMSKSSPYSVQDLYGSYAGAFGIPQFLPSSYLKWAVDGNHDSLVNLYNTEDAIFSIANYLKSNGWAPDEDSQRKAVFHYNNSWEYVDGVMKLANRLMPKKTEEETEQ